MKAFDAFDAFDDTSKNEEYKREYERKRTNIL